MGKGRGGSLTDAASAVDSALSTTFGALAKAVAKTPVPFIPACVLFAIIMGANNVRMFATLELRPSKMFCPPDSPAIPQSTIVADNFDSAKRVEAFIVTGANVLDKATLVKAQRILDTLKTMQTEPVAPTFPAAQPAQPWDFSQLCIKDGRGDCYVMSLLNLWGQNATVLDSQTQDEILARVNNPPPQFPAIASLVGSITRNAAGEITGAGALQTTMLLEYRADPDFAEAGTMVAPWTDVPSETWEQLMIDTLASMGDDVVYNTQKSQVMEYFYSALSDLSKLAIGYLLVFGYTALTFGSAFPCLPFNPGASAVQSRSIMTLACVATLQMSLVTTAGLCSLGGLMLTPVHGALPFILLGVCVDDAFVIVTCFNEECGWHLPPEDTAGREKAMARPIEERLSAAMEHAGCSITITSLTNVVAFAVGHSSQLPMLSSFCMFASVGVLAIYGYMLTFFTACLAIDDRRQAAKRQDCCPCFVNEEVALASRGGKLREFFGETYAPFLLQTPVRIAVISVAFIWFCVSLWMSADLDQEWDWMNFIPDDSYIRDFMLTRQDHFEASFEYPLDVVWQPPAFPAIKQLADLQTALEASNWVKPGSIESWYPAFCDAQTAAVAAAAAAGTATVANVCEDASTTASSFMAALNAWLSNPEGRQFRNHIVLSADGSSVLTTRMLAVHNPATVVTSENMVDAMFGLREDIAAAVPGAFPFTYQYMFWEQFAVVKEELYVNCSLALLCVMIICTILTAHPGIALLMCLMVGLTLCGMGGIDWIIGHHIDAIGMVCFAFSVGISVDYSVHIGHNFLMQTEGDRSARVKAVLVEMGVPVFHGAFSTFLAIVMLSTAVSFSMRTFFKQFASVVIFGSFNALALLPCLLSFIGPAPLEGRGKNDELEMQVQGKGSGDDEDDSAAGGDSEEGQD